MAHGQPVYFYSDSNSNGFKTWSPQSASVVSDFLIVVVSGDEILRDIKVTIRTVAHSAYYRHTDTVRRETDRLELPQYTDVLYGCTLVIDARRWSCEVALDVLTITSHKLP